MVDIIAFQGAITGLKLASDIAKGFFNLKSMAEVQGLTIELQGAILAAQTSALAAQSEQFTMVQRIRELEEEIARIKAWEEEKKRYQLTPPWEGVPALVYALKESCKGTEPPHWICTKCYDDGRRTILQPKIDANGWAILTCATCKLESHTSYRGIGSAEYVKG